MGSRNRLPVVLIVLGAGLAVFASLADFIGLGRAGGVPAVQVLVAEFGALLVFAGIWWSIRRREGMANQPGSAGDPAGPPPSQPVFTWVLVGFLLSYLLFFIVPTFLNSSHQFRYPAGFFFEREHIGFDTRLTLEHVRVWFTGERQAKYIFPPLTTILFAPLLLLRYPATYTVMTVLTLVSALILNLLIPLRMIRKENYLPAYFIFGVSIFAYGFQFELETGQFYTIAMALAMAAIWVFHRHPAYRVFAYILFCVSVQLKVIPAVFILTLVDDWRDWRSNLRRFAALGLANFLLLFLLGGEYFNAFVTHLFEGTATHELEYNHSIYAFVTTLSTTGYEFFHGSALEWIQANAGGIAGGLTVFTLLCLGMLVWHAHRRDLRGFNAPLLMACTLTALMLPAISHDYKLPMLTAPFVLALSGARLGEAPWKRIASIVLITLASFAYSATLVPWNARPVYLHNAFPLLFILLIVVTGLVIINPTGGIDHEGHKGTRRK